MKMKIISALIAALIAISLNNEASAYPWKIPPQHKLQEHRTCRVETLNGEVLPEQVENAAGTPVNENGCPESYTCTHGPWAVRIKGIERMVYRCEERKEGSTGEEDTLREKRSIDEVDGTKFGQSEGKFRKDEKVRSERKQQAEGGERVRKTMMDLVKNYKSKSSNSYNNAVDNDKPKQDSYESRIMNVLNEEEVTTFEGKETNIPIKKQPSFIDNKGMKVQTGETNGEMDVDILAKSRAKLTMDEAVRRLVRERQQHPGSVHRALKAFMTMRQKKSGNPARRILPERRHEPCKILTPEGEEVESYPCPENSVCANGPYNGRLYGWDILVYLCELPSRPDSEDGQTSFNRPRPIVRKMKSSKYENEEIGKYSWISGY